MKLTKTVLLAIWIASTADAGCEDFSDPDMRAGCEMGEQLLPTFDDDGEAVFKNWTLFEKRSEMTDGKNVFLSVQSRESVQCNFNLNNEKVTLYVRCLENTTTSYIATPCHVASGFDGYGKVTYRIDKEAPRTRNFEASTSNESLGFWSYRKSKPFIDDMFGASNLLVRFTPFGENPREVSFDISGIETEIEPLRRACNW